MCSVRHVLWEVAIFWGHMMTETGNTPLHLPPPTNMCEGVSPESALHQVDQQPYQAGSVSWGWWNWVVLPHSDSCLNMQYKNKIKQAEVLAT